MLGYAFKYLASVRDRSEHAATQERSKADSPAVPNALGTETPKENQLNILSQ
jgi:hypothetical protein